MGMMNVKPVPEAKTSGEMPKLYVGFEIETNLHENEQVRRFLKTRYDVNSLGHTRGLANSSSNSVRVGDVVVSVSGGSSNRYEKPGLVTDCYEDGSVGLEFVTRPVLTDKISVIRDMVFNPLKTELNADMVAQGRAGLHMTFLTDHHKCLSVFNPLWVKNVQQIVRFFYPDIIQWRFTATDTMTRPVGYRSLFSRNEVVNTGRSNHHSAVSLRYIDPNTGNYGVWGVEIRIPDGTNDWAAVEAQVKFWRAIFELAWNCAKVGMFEFSQDVWDTNQVWYGNKPSNASENRDMRWKKGKGNNKLVLTKLLIPFMRDPLPANHINTWVEWYNKQQGNSADAAPTTTATIDTQRAA